MIWISFMLMAKMFLLIRKSSSVWWTRAETFYLRVSNFESGKATIFLNSVVQIGIEKQLSKKTIFALDSFSSLSSIIYVSKSYRVVALDLWNFWNSNWSRYCSTNLTELIGWETWDFSSKIDLYLDRISKSLKIWRFSFKLSTFAHSSLTTRSSYEKLMTNFK